MKNEHRVLTPESVEFVYELAGLSSRMLAVVLDHLIILALLLVVWLVVLSTGMLMIITAAIGLLVSFILYFGYFTYFEWKWTGQTPGKRVLDLRVIDDRGINVDLFQSFVRNLMRIADMMPAFSIDFIGIGFYALGGVVALANPRQKRLGDWAAGTLVVRTRKQVMPSAIIAPSDKYNSLQEDPSLRARIRSRLTMDERETLLQLCLRRNELEFEARQTLFREAAEYLEGRLEVRREEFLSEEKFVQNITAVALSEAESGLRVKGGGVPVGR